MFEANDFFAAFTNHNEEQMKMIFFSLKQSHTVSDNGLPRMHNAHHYIKQSASELIKDKVPRP